MNNPIKSKNENKPVAKDEKRVFSLAILVLIWGLAAVAALGIIAIIFSVKYGKQEDVFTSVKDILAITLPVISVWVGSVLAYYFSKENFESASNQSQKMFKEFLTSEEKLKSIIAKDVMIKIENAVKLVLDKPEDQLFLKKDLIDNMLDKDMNNRRNRLPVFDKKMIAKYMIHRSIIDKFIVEKTSSGTKTADKLTLKDMIDDKEYLEMISESFGTVSELSNLLDAKHYIDRIDNCLDVFVTNTGLANSPVIGWITNAIITKESTI